MRSESLLSVLDVCSRIEAFVDVSYVVAEIVSVVLVDIEKVTNLRVSAVSVVDIDSPWIDLYRTRVHF